MVKTGTNEASCIFAGNKLITRIMCNNNKIYPSFVVDWLTYPSVRSYSRHLSVTFKVNRYNGQNWRIGDFVVNGNGTDWILEYSGSYFITIIRKSTGLTAWTIPQNASYITGICIQKCADKMDMTNLAKGLSNLTEIRIKSGVRNLYNLKSMAANTPKLKYVFCDLKNFKVKYTNIDYAFAHSKVKYVQALDTTRGRSNTFTDVPNMIRPSVDERKWLSYTFGSRYRMIGLEESIECTGVTNRTSANHEFKQFKYQPVIVQTTDVNDSRFTAFSSLGLFDENGVEFSRGAGTLFTSTPYYGDPAFAFDGDWLTTWHSGKGIAETFMGKKFATPHRLDCVRMKGREIESQRGPLLFWILGRNEDTEAWQIVMVCDKIPHYSSTWSNNEQCAWYPEHSRRIFEKCETSPDGTKIIFAGIPGRTFFTRKPGTATNYFSVFVNGQKINITSDLANQTDPLDTAFTVSPPIEKGQTIELSYDEPPVSIEYLSIKDNRHAASTDPDFTIRVPSISLMSVDNKSTVV